MLLKSTLRTIKKSLGRYIAILAIIALGVGFFAGLRVTEPTMLKTANGYINEHNLYDFRLVSTLGFTDDDVAAFEELNGIDIAKGSVSSDVIVKNKDEADTVLHAHTLLEDINGVDLLSGTKPSNDNECVVDSRYATEDLIGTTLKLSENNPEDVFNVFSYKEYRIVGIVDSVEYINFQRGTTALAGGTALGFMYIPAGGFNADYYTEIFLSIPTNAEMYSKDYDLEVDSVRENVEDLLETRADIRFDSIYNEAKSKLDEAKAQLELAKPMLPPQAIEQMEVELQKGYNELEELKKPTVYALDRNSNFGYVTFENDIQIVSGVAKVFPLFFFLVAALVCITTMTRMVNEQRTQNGILKALGYNNFAVASQYLIYSGSASIFGCVIGFLIGSKFMPMILWEVYHIMYTIARPAAFVLDWKLFIVCTLLYLICSLGVTYFVCRKDLRENAAQLMRPKAPSAGKRIFLEKVGFIWKRTKFLHKVSIRNIFRYKKRMVMMIIGIGGCMALLLTGFGIRDTIQPIVDYQFGEINLYNASVSFMQEPTAEERAQFEEDISDFTKQSVMLHSGNVDMLFNDSEKSVTIYAYDSDLSSFIDIHEGKKALAWPKNDEAVINYRLADKYGIKVGDEIELRDSSYGSMKVTVSGIYDNYIYDGIYITAETYESGFGYAPKINTAYLNFMDGNNDHEIGAQLLSMYNVASVNLVSEMKETVGNMLETLNYVVLIVLVCAGALAFIVLYNLTNITITERTREIATLKVLGFYKGEQKSYVFRENIILSVIGAICGIIPGILLLNYTMGQIQIDNFYFGCRLSWLSFVWSLLLTVLFTVVVDLILSRKLKKINMAEAMKAID